MRPIKMVDIYSQYNKIKTEIDFEIHKVIESTSFINGTAVNEFKEDLEKYLDVKHVIPCANGTDALQVALMSLNLEPGDEIITSNFTFIATAEVIALLKLKPVLVDVDFNSFLIDPELIEKAITPKTKAIVPVHLFGQVSNMEVILELAQKNNLSVIEDNAQALGANFYFTNGSSKKAGTIGDIGCTSFFPSKNLGCFGDGGAIFTNHEILAGRIRSIVNHGMQVRYYHDHVGINSRLDTMQAAILKVKLPNLDLYNKARIRAADFYDKAFSGHPDLVVPKREKFSDHIFHQYTLIINNISRDKLREELEKRGVPSMIYYPVPIHLQKAFRDLGHQTGDFPVTEMLSRKVLSLPMHSELDQEQLEFITQSTIEAIESFK